jgi:hypothetical protein
MKEEQAKLEIGFSHFPLVADLPTLPVPYRLQEQRPTNGLCLFRL